MLEMLDKIKTRVLVTAVCLSITGCALPSYELPSGYSRSYERALDAFDRRPAVITPLWEQQGAVEPGTMATP